jgi:hypothetical protein
VSSTSTESNVGPYPEARPSRSLPRDVDIIRGKGDGQSGSVAKISTFFGLVRRVLIGSKPESSEESPKQVAADAPSGSRTTKPDGVGICLSGGGIRSASYCLGALQSLSRHGLLSGEQSAKYLSTVSGGSYIATALTMVTKGPADGESNPQDDKKRAIVPPRTCPPGMPDRTPFAHGSPEEQYLRDHTLYLTHGRAGVPGVVWRILLGVIFNLAIVTIGLALFTVPLGWLYATWWPSLRAGCPTSCPVSSPFAIPQGLWLSIILVSATAFLIGFVWLAWRFRNDTRRTWCGGISGVLLASSLAMLLFFVAIPEVIHLARPFYLTLTPPGSDPTTKTTTVTVASVGLVGVLGAWLAAARRLMASAGSVEKEAIKGIGGFVEKHRQLMLAVAATIAGPLLVLTGVVISAYWGAAYRPGFSGSGGWELLAWVAVVVVSLLLWFRADVTVWSLYPIYRNRLSSAFVLKRIERADGDPPSPTAVGNEDAMPRPYADTYQLSKFQPKDFPELIICAAANISDYGKTPSGSHVTSFTFSSKYIGGPLVGAQRTVDYEEAIGRHNAQARFTTLPTAMAISGAAFSPSMGKMTRAPYRFFLALANLRLGVWVPNPRRLEKFKSRNVLHQVLPRPQYFLREMFGRNHLDAPFLYVTDGGHYENLGLVELLRRKCKKIWCIDASGDHVDTFDTLGGALQTAQAELQVTIDIEPLRDIKPSTPAGSKTQYVKQPFCKGTIHYPDGETGELVLVKAGVPLDAPWSIRAYALQHPKFPCDPTLDQLFDAERFEAYRELGEFSVDRAMAQEGDTRGLVGDGGLAIPAPD